MKIQQDKDGQRNTAHRFYRLRRSSIMIEAFTRGNGAQMIIGSRHTNGMPRGGSLGFGVTKKVSWQALIIQI
jgi:hypothetical protein